MFIVADLVSLQSIISSQICVFIYMMLHLQYFVENFKLCAWFLLAEAECVMIYLSIIEVDYKFCLLEKTTTELFLI